MHGSGTLTGLVNRCTWRGLGSDIARNGCIDMFQCTRSYEGMLFRHCIWGRMLVAAMRRDIRGCLLMPRRRLHMTKHFVIQVWSCQRWPNSAARQQEPCRKQDTQGWVAGLAAQGGLVHGDVLYGGSIQWRRCSSADDGRSGVDTSTEISRAFASRLAVGFEIGPLAPKQHREGTPAPHFWPSRDEMRPALPLSCHAVPRHGASPTRVPGLG